MKIIHRRLQRLEEPLRLAQQKCRVYPLVLVSLENVNREPALDIDTCLKILDECGHTPKSRFAVANFSHIPDGLNATETESFLRKSGAVLFSGHGR